MCRGGGSGRGVGERRGWFGSARRVTEAGEVETGGREGGGVRVTGRKSERERERISRTRMESIRGGKCVLLAPHACFHAWGDQTREFLRGERRRVSRTLLPWSNPRGHAGVSPPFWMRGRVRNIRRNVTGILRRCLRNYGFEAIESTRKWICRENRNSFAETQTMLQNILARIIKSKVFLIFFKEL